MSSKLWITDEGTFIRNPAELGYAETDCGPNFLTRGSAYCELVTKIRVTTIAVDSHGHYRHRYFSTIDAAVKFVRNEGLTGDGGVSSDGVVRFADAGYRVASSYFHPFASLNAFLKAAA